jgi:hypothetical protein
MKRRTQQCKEENISTWQGKPNNAKRKAEQHKEESLAV